jgi:flagellar assembly protein FliH
MTANIAPYTFDLDFEAKEEDIIEPVIPVSEHEALLARAREQARKEGFEEGEASQAIQEQKAIDSKLADIAAQLQALQAEVNEKIIQHHKEAIDLARTIAMKLAGTIIEHDPVLSLDDFLQETLGELKVHSRISIIVSKDMGKAIRNHLKASLQQGDLSNMTIIEDDKLQAGDCSITWDDGSFSYSRTQLMRNVNDAITQYCQSLDALDNPDHLYDKARQALDNVPDRSTS